MGPSYILHILQGCILHPTVGCVGSYRSQHVILVISITTSFSWCWGCKYSICPSISPHLIINSPRYRHPSLTAPVSTFSHRYAHYVASCLYIPVSRGFLHLVEADPMTECAGHIKMTSLVQLIKVGLRRYRLPYVKVEGIAITALIDTTIIIVFALRY